jgi:hypothetical protein
MDKEKLEKLMTSVLSMTLCGAAHEIERDEEMTEDLGLLEELDSPALGTLIVSGPDGRRWSVSVTATEIP